MLGLAYRGRTGREAFELTWRPWFVQWVAAAAAVAAVAAAEVVWYLVRNKEQLPWPSLTCATEETLHLAEVDPDQLPRECEDVLQRLSVRPHRIWPIPAASGIPRYHKHNPSIRVMQWNILAQGHGSPKCRRPVMLPTNQVAIVQTPALPVTGQRLWQWPPPTRKPEGGRGYSAARADPQRHEHHIQGRAARAKRHQPSLSCMWDFNAEPQRTLQALSSLPCLTSDTSC
ncbi:nocturnin isoform X1 [Lates japonicus]|uniref:Nocturnin isoform X1 n=1 Tax=Lates japonicus TaxID=270547 RepID=A0AAD3NHA9_LATJO|nr:nocturnin isoform X1 [Lates japonicus]